jgi:ATP-binding cassette, subfamily B, bacterial
MSSMFSENRAFLVQYLAPQRGRVVVLTVLLFGSIGLQLANPQVLRRFIDEATGQGAVSTLINTGIIFICVALLQQIVSVGATYFSENVGWTATNNLRADLLHHVLRLDQSFHKTRTPGELISRIDGDVTTLANFFSRLVIQVVGNLMLLVGVLAILWMTDWRIGLLLSVCALLVLGSLVGLQYYIQPFWKKVQETKADLIGFLEERLSATEDIRSNGAQEYTLQRFYERHRLYFGASWRARIRAPLVWGTADGLFTVATCAVILISVSLYRDGTLTVGMIYSIFTYIALLWMPLHTMAEQAEEFQKAGAGIARVRELLAAHTALVPGTGGTLPNEALSVQFEGVRFGYGDDETVIRDMTWSLPAGKTLGILGRTGSGKTTMTRLLFRLYDPQEGTIRLSGADVRDVPLHNLRRRVGIVTQEVQLFNAPVRDNLAFFDRSIDDARILDALGELGLEPWLRSLPHGLDTVMTSGSGGLSAGEAQLLAFTRIFLRDPGLVILDEASSRLDPATEELIERAIDKLMQGRTGLIIAHRLDTVHRADEILILEDGHVLENGPREDLLADPDSRFNALLRTGIEEALA